MSAPFLEIWTIGHSTHSASEFLELLQTYRIECLADVRRFPGSRKFPHFNEPELRRFLGQAHIRYDHFPELGGRRRPLPDSPNDVWRNESFRGYADYMETELFVAAIDRLSDAARNFRTAIMCAESVWWRCHRALISDYLKARGDSVTHIMSATKTELHSFTTAARVENGVLTYHRAPSLPGTNLAE